ncbi:MAG2-interacting protein 2 [Coffea eugenioides]|uniref:MAG2-interacting protein 2 n=1 Tax=Coffea eugenioides TaxID=49369 RepID=UPI000F613F86|nr:MAG2-interacting protein 2 [Coffea eugenioides]
MEIDATHNWNPSMGGGVREVLFEVRRHASGTYSNYPPTGQQVDDGRGRTLLSYFSLRGITQMKERWTEYRNPKKVGKHAALFISPHADRVAVAFRNQITFLQKDDDYQQPSGTFTSGNISAFTCGTWSEAHEVLGVFDDTNTLYFIKANGEEITRITGKHLKVSLPILCLILQDDNDVNKACLCTFSILTSDGSLHDLEISQDLSASMSAAPLARTGVMLKKQFPKNVFCMHHHPKLSLFATISSASGVAISNTSGHPGSPSLSLWQRSSSSDLELMVSIDFEGLYAEAKGVDQLISPKVLISPEGNFVGTLDARGCLLIFKFHQKQWNLSNLYNTKRHDLQMKNDLSGGGMDFLNDIVDFTWWSDDVLAVAKRDGTITMFDVPTGVKLLEKDPVYSMPIMETVEKLSGCLFLLESTSGQSYKSSEEKRTTDLRLIEQLECAKLQWNLFSLSERSVSEMYDLLIRKQDYQVALSFAHHHGLDKDELLKSQWMSSSQGVNEINKLLSTIKDHVFVLSECVDCVGPTEDAEKALLAYGLHLTENYRFSKSQEDESSQVWDFRMARLKLLLFRDRLETFLGINMGRFSAQEYNKFRNLPINDAAVALAETGKIGALNLLFKRHPYSLGPYILEVLAAIPETVPVQSYAQLLPGNSPPASIALREEDWVECDKMVSFINSLPEDHGSRVLIRTEPIVKRYMGFQWPSTADLSSWYKNRARDIDTLSGQLENCMCLVDFGYQKGISELQHFYEDISFLRQLIYSDENEGKRNFFLSLIAWEKLSDYEKFRLLLRGVTEEDVIGRLKNIAIPFMQKRDYHIAADSTDELTGSQCTMDNTADSFLVRWLKEISLENKLGICLIVFEEGCTDLENSYFFKDEAQVVDCALQCMYLCSSTDRWSTMSSILSKLQHLRGYGNEDLKTRLKVTEGHVEAGRILAIYQVPKPINYFREPHTDEKGVKQTLRLILSKFIRRQMGRSDNDWANMWRDLQSLQEKAFPFLDLEYMLIEFCRGLLKAGKFPLARNYLKSTGSVVLAADKAETLVIQAAREYFFSASSLDCPEIWKAKECLNILPSSRNARVEADVIDALTLKLPKLGVNVLPLQFRQMKDPLEIIKLAITSQDGAYLNVDELIEIAKLLGLSSHDEISSVQEAIAREAAVAGDLQLAFDLCRVLAKKGHGSVWDLCAALARGPALDNMDVNSRKHLLGFSLSHCDEESIGDLLNGWKDLDMMGQCETLMMLTGSEPPESAVQGTLAISYPLYSTQGSVDFGTCSGKVDNVGYGDQGHLDAVKDFLSLVAENLPFENGYQWESILRENGKILSFSALRLPWLLELSTKAETTKKHISGSVSGKQYISVRTQAVVTIISWLARNGFAPKDNLIISIAKSIMEPPVTEEEDIMGCSFLLNLVDGFSGVDIIEGFVKARESYNEIMSIMNVGLIYGLLHNCRGECEEPAQRRMLLLREFQQKHKSVASDERDELDKAQSAFWREWKLKLEDQKRVADHSRVLEQIIPGVETARFLSGDTSYRESVVFSFIESIKLEKKHVLEDVIKLAHTYGLDQTKVLLHYISSTFTSEAWTVDDIVADLSQFRNEVISSAAETITVITVSVYPLIDGHDKQRLAYIYGLLAECYLQLEELKEPLPTIGQSPMHLDAIHLARFSKVVSQECFRVSFIGGLNFKKIAGLTDLNWDCFNDEVFSHISEKNVEALADMVRNLIGLYGDSLPEGLLSWQYVYRHHVLNLLTTFETQFKTDSLSESPENFHCFLSELEQTYNAVLKYVKFIEYPGILDIMMRFFAVMVPFEKPSSKRFDSMWQECLLKLLNMWLKMMSDMQELKYLEHSDESFCSESLVTCLKVFINLILKGKVSPIEGWGTIISFSNSGVNGDAIVEIFNFCRAMLFSGCRFLAVAYVFTDALSQLSPGSALALSTGRCYINIQDLPHLYISLLEMILLDLDSGSLEKQKFHSFLSSLSKLEGNLEDLKCVRDSVWKKLAEVSDNLQLPSHSRVYILELMQCIRATDKELKVFSSELDTYVIPWEGWENVQSGCVNHEKTSDVADTANRFTNTLVALKSSQMLSAISPSLEIAPEDLLTTESAVSCFVKVSESAKSESEIDTLIAMLGVWEELFMYGRKDSPKVDDIGNSWSNDDWDEGWESFLEESREKESKSNSTLLVHPLHVCWLEIVKKLIRLSRYEEFLRLADKYKGNTTQILLDEDDARCLSQIMLELNCFIALKIMLLLPYEAVQLQCLEAVEVKLKQTGIPDEFGKDYEFLLLLLSSGIIVPIITKSSYGATFSCLCYMFGNVSRQWQEAQLSSLKYMIASEDKSNLNLIFVFTRLLFPCFLAELVKADQQILAGFFVTKFMHTSASFSIVNVVDASLRRYFEKQLLLLDDDEASWEGINSSEPLLNTILSFRDRLGELIPSALSLLPAPG